MAGDVGDKLRQLEIKLFSGVKSEVETATKSVWQGSQKQQQLANDKIRYLQI